MRTLRDDARILRNRVLPVLGAALPVRKLTATMVAQFEAQRLRTVTAYRVANEVSVLRHMLRVGRRLGYLETVPEITLPKKPAGRLRYLDEGEIARLLAACARSQNPWLRPIVVLALHTGLRKGELLRLEWERVDLASARITLLRTKSGKPRGVPINRAVSGIAGQG